MSKQVLFIANSLDNAFKFQSVLSTLDVGVSAGSTQQVRRLLAPGADVDLVIFEAREKTFVHLQEVISLSESRGSALLVITDEACVDELLLMISYRHPAIHEVIPYELIDGESISRPCK